MNQGVIGICNAILKHVEQQLLSYLVYSDNRKNDTHRWKKGLIDRTALFFWCFGTGLNIKREDQFSMVKETIKDNLYIFYHSPLCF